MWQYNTYARHWLDKTTRSFKRIGSMPKEENRAIRSAAKEEDHLDEMCNN